MNLNTQKVIEFFEQYDPSTAVMVVTPTFGDEVARLKLETNNDKKTFALCAGLVEFTEEDITYPVEEVLSQLGSMTTDEFFFGQFTDFGFMPMQLISKAYEDNTLILVVDYI